MRMRAALATLMTLLSALVFVVGTAQASPAVPAAQPVAVADSVGALAWECAVGDFCAWTGRDGTGSRCAWTNADNDWRVAPVICSWSGSQRVQSYWNRGTSTSFRGVKLYQSADYANLAYCVPQGGAYNIDSGGTFLRSHRWGSWTPGTCGP